MVKFRRAKGKTWPLVKFGRFGSTNNWHVFQEKIWKCTQTHKTLRMSAIINESSQKFNEHLMILLKLCERMRSISEISKRLMEIWWTCLWCATSIKTKKHYTLIYPILQHNIKRIFSNCFTALSFQTNVVPSVQYVWSLHCQRIWYVQCYESFSMCASCLMSLQQEWFPQGGF